MSRDVPGVGSLDLVLVQGATFHRELTWGTGSLVNGEWVIDDPYDLTGYSARMQVRKGPEVDEVLLELTSDTDGGITLGTTDGTITIDIPPEVSDEIDFDYGRYDLELEDPGTGTIRRILMGAFAVSRGTTR